MVLAVRSYVDHNACELSCCEKCISAFWCLHLTCCWLWNRTFLDWLDEMMCKGNWWLKCLEWWVTALAFADVGRMDSGSYSSHREFSLALLSHNDVCIVYFWMLHWCSSCLAIIVPKIIKRATKHKMFNSSVASLCLCIIVAESQRALTKDGDIHWMNKISK